MRKVCMAYRQRPAFTTLNPNSINHAKANPNKVFNRALCYLVFCGRTGFMVKRDILQTQAVNKLGQ